MPTVTSETIAPQVRAEIGTRLAAIEAAHDVRLLLAVESGSRAWGFPSPDSDYDVRFVYVRRRDWYLSLVPGRDVIETPIVDAIDLNGWDIRKALGLLLRSNAVIGEWMASPIRYRPDHPAVASLARLADDVLDARALAHHYASLGRTAAERWLTGEGVVSVKKYFYALRPALAIRYLRLHGGARPPMDLRALMAAGRLAPELHRQIDDLVAAKARTNERGNAMRCPDLDALIRDELGRVGEVRSRTVSPDAAQAANTLFLELMNP